MADMFQYQSSPYLRRDVERACLELLDHYRIEYGDLAPPIDEQRLAKLVGATIRRGGQELASQGTVGEQRGAPVIRVSRLDSTRRRFVVVHEIVHTLLGEHRLGHRSESESEYRSRESIIDYGAALLLIPSEPLKRFFASSELSVDLIERASRLFKVKITVLVRRLFSEIDLGEDWAMLLAHQGPNPKSGDRSSWRVLEFLSNGPWFLPQHIKIEKIGLSAIAVCAESCALSESLRFKEEVRLKVRDAQGTPKYPWRSVAIRGEARLYGKATDPYVFALFRGSRTRG